MEYSRAKYRTLTRRVKRFTVNSYETKAGDPMPVDFVCLAQTEEEISSDQSSSPVVLICEGTIVYVRKGI